MTKSQLRVNESDQGHGWERDGFVRQEDVVRRCTVVCKA